MKKSIILILILFFALSNISNVYAIENEPEISGPTAVLMEFSNGQVLYDKNMHKRMYPASTTKTLTAIIAIQKGNLDDIVTANDDVTKIDGNSMYLVPGEQLTLRQLLYAMLLESDNDAAVAIADHIGGNIKDFAEMMNQKAKEIGAKDSHFVNPNGLPDNNHYSTPYDMALIARYAMQNDIFRQIVSTVHYQIPPTNKYNKARDLWISNKLIKPTNFHYDGADGVKTGYTVVAKQVLIASATRNSHRLISVIMGDEGTNIWSDTIKLLNYGFDNFNLVKKNDNNEIITYATIGKVNFKVPLIAKEPFYYIVKKGEENNVKSEIVLNKQLKTPIEKGSALGYIKYSLNGSEIGRVPLLSGENVYKNLMGTYYNKDRSIILNSNDNIINYLKFISGLLILFIAIAIWRKKRIRSKRNYIFSKD
jgi:D-alanyl-D-alanine carboxypeptidase (penicillin-binding protein 5/6)